MKTKDEILDKIIDLMSEAIPKSERNDFMSKRKCPTRDICLLAMEEWSLENLRITLK